MSARFRPLPQPAKAFIALRPDLTNRGIASANSVSEGFVGRCLNGHVPTPHWLAQAIADELGVEVSEAFRDELLVQLEGAA